MYYRSLGYTTVIKIAERNLHSGGLEVHYYKKKREKEDKNDEGGIEGIEGIQQTDLKDEKRIGI